MARVFFVVSLGVLRNAKTTDVAAWLERAVSSGAVDANGGDPPTIVADAIVEPAPLNVPALAKLAAELEAEGDAIQSHIGKLNSSYADVALWLDYRPGFWRRLGLLFVPGMWPRLDLSSYEAKLAAAHRAAAGIASRVHAVRLILARGDSMSVR